MKYMQIDQDSSLVPLELFMPRCFFVFPLKKEKWIKNNLKLFVYFFNNAKRAGKKWREIQNKTVSNVLLHFAFDFLSFQGF